MRVCIVMAHYRERFLTDFIKKALSYSPIVGLLGQRQVGKTTLMERISTNYKTMDDPLTLQIANSNPNHFLSELVAPCTIDECQLAPSLFPALKIWVQKNKKPGQFILSGSIRFTSRKSIQESLTGRILNFELLPLTLAEIKGLPVLNYFLLFKKSTDHIKNELYSRQKKIPKIDFSRYLERGGMPGICFIRENPFRRAKLRTHLETLLQRDIRWIINTTAPYDSLLALITYLAEKQGETFFLKEAANASRLSQNTVKKIIEAFEGLFLIRKVIGVGHTSSPQYYLEDQGLANYLAPKTREQSPSRWIFSQIFGNLHYSTMNEYSIGYYQTKVGLHINFVITHQKQSIGFVFDPDEIISHKTLSAIKAFKTDYPTAVSVILSPFHNFTKMDSGTFIMNMNEIV